MSVLLRLTSYALPYWRLMVVTMAVTLLAASADLVVPRLLRDVIDVGLAQGDRAVLIVLAVLVVAFTAGRGIFQFGRMFLAELLSQRVVFALRNILYDHIQHLSFRFHDRTRTGELMARTTSDVERVRRFASMGVFQMTQILVLTSGIALILLVTEWQLGLVALTTVPVLAFIAVAFARRIRPLHQHVQQAWADLNVVLQENLAGARVVRAFAQEDAELGKFRPANDRLTARIVRTMRLFAVRAPLFNAVLGFGQVAVLWYGGWKIIDGQMTLGTLVAFNTYLLLLAQPVRMLGLTINSFARAQASGVRIFEILDERSEVVERPTAQPLAAARGDVTFERVSFTYGGQRVLDDVSFHVRAGQAIGIVGGTGSGKSTIINLLPRFYDPTHGRVLFDGCDLRDLQIKPLRAQIGIVHQEPFVFATSIRENIAYGRTEATTAEIVAAAEAAQIHDFIADLPKGYATEVGERGVTLSGGQKQRVAIARAILLNPRVLVLDESTSSVDTWTERAIQDSLRALMRGRTSVIISQRIRSVREAAEILVLEEGRIVQRGTHAELVEQDGLYREMYLLQEAEAERLRLETAELVSAPAVGGT
ncbi:MAG: ABC transporter ATP-binding protein [Actinobacteria bacterium]|nr:ABC transporter ATP-binding protein [Actinomycetota bacterium]